MTSQSLPDRLLTTREAADFLGVKPGTLDTWRSSKRYGLSYVKVGKHIRYRPSDLQEWIDSRTVISAAGM